MQCEPTKIQLQAESATTCHSSQNTSVIQVSSSFQNENQYQKKEEEFKITVITVDPVSATKVPHIPCKENQY